jgi:hypothetical protein
VGRRAHTGGDIYAQNVDCDGSLGNTSPAGWSNYCIGAPNSVGPGAVMSASGSTSLALDNFVLGCSGLPPTTNGIFFFGASQIQVPFGNGFRCVGGTVVRFGVQTTTPGGTVQRAIQQNCCRAARSRPARRATSSSGTATRSRAARAST